MSAPLPNVIAPVVMGYPKPATARFLELRALLYGLADQMPDTGGLTETLKWGEPSFAPVKARVGTPVRLAWKPARPNAISLFVNCQTPLVEHWRSQFPALDYVGNRELVIPLDGDLPSDIRTCMSQAMTYHLKKPAD